MGRSADRGLSGPPAGVGGRLVLPVALLATVAVAGLQRLRSYDLFWHLASGRWILESRALPTEDPLRFTSRGAPWVDHEWLFQATARAIESAFGLGGLSALRVLVVVGVAVVLLIAARRAGAAPVPAALVVLAAILGARPRFMLRPELASLLALVLLLLALQQVRRTGGWRPLVTALAVVVVWANLHPGVLAAVPVTGAFLLGCLLPGGHGVGRGGAAPVRWTLVLGATAATAGAILANPAGYGLFLVPVKIGRALEGLPVTNPEWTPAWVSPQPGFLAGVAALAVLAGVCLWRARRLDPATGLAALALLGLAVTGVRHQGLFFLGGAFFALECLADLARVGRARGEGRAPALAVVACVLVAAWCVVPPATGPLRPRQGPVSFGVGLEPRRYPVDAAAFIARTPSLGPLYNDVAFGGYLLWRLYPRPVFIDGRNEVNPDLLRRLALSRTDALAWNELLDEEGAEGVVVRYDDRPRPVVVPGGGPGDGDAVERHTPAAVLYPAERWALVHWDDVAMILARRGSEAASALPEHRYVHPEDVAFMLERAAASPAFREAALREVEGHLEAHPGLERAQEIRDALLALAAR